MKIEDFISEFGEKKTHHFLMSEHVYLTFQKCSGDINVLHIDDNYAIEKGFIQKVMYGNILNNFISYFVGMCMPCADVMLLKQDIIYLQPIYMGDNIDMIVNISDSYPKYNILDFKYIFKRNDMLIARGHFQIKLL